jgi:hypothetical protein
LEAIREDARRTFLRFSLAQHEEEEWNEAHPDGPEWDGVAAAEAGLAAEAAAEAAAAAKQQAATLQPRRLRNLFGENDDTAQVDTAEADTAAQPATEDDRQGCLAI